MSLQLWLPLLGNTDNQGLSEYIFSVSNTSYITVDNAGKLGKCYNFNSSAINNGIYSPDNGFMNKYINNHSFSFCAWINIASTITNTPIICLSYGLRFIAGNTSNTRLNLYNSTLGHVNCMSSVALNDGKWHHFAGTYDVTTNKMAVYVDGVNTGNAIYPSGTYSSSWANGLFIGRDPNSSSVSDAVLFKGKMNDIRIYDHALSPKEIKEISKGLVCHYKLDNNGAGNPSIFDFSNTAKWYADGTTLSMYKDPSYGSVLDVIAESGQTRIYRNVTNIWELNQVYTVSFLARASSTAKCTMSRSLVNFTSEFTLTTEWKRYTGTITSSATVAGGTLSFQITTLNVDVYITQIKLEYGDIATPYCPSVDSSQYNMLGYNENIVYDSSGYNNHGSSINLSVSPNSARNSLATVFNGTSSKITLTSPFVSTVKNPQMSFAFWMNRNNYTDGAARYIYFDYCYIYLHTDYKLRIGWSHATADSKSNNTWACGLLVPAAEWHHICFTFSDGVMKVYCDGQLYNTSDRSDTGQFMAIRRTGGTLGVNDASDYFGGSLSDFRIYPTALSAEDVLALYNAPVSVTNTGAMMTQGEFVEVIS